MTEASDEDQLQGSSAVAATDASIREVRVVRRELRLISGIILVSIGAAVSLAAFLVLFDYRSTTGWLLIAAATVAAAGLMLMGSGMAGRLSSLGNVIFAATPGGFFAVIGFSVANYLQPFSYSARFLFIWIAIGYLGLLWMIAGPVVTYRVKTRLRVAIADAGGEDSDAAPDGHTDKATARLAAATWCLVLAGLIGPILAVLVTHLLGP